VEIREVSEESGEVFTEAADESQRTVAPDNSATQRKVFTPTVKAMILTGFVLLPLAMAIGQYIFVLVDYNEDNYTVPWFVPFGVPIAGIFTTVSWVRKRWSEQTPDTRVDAMVACTGCTIAGLLGTVVATAVAAFALSFIGELVAGWQYSVTG
jgi:hypothetical protein